MKCSAPVPAGVAHEIGDGGRTVTITVDWGADDSRVQHEKTMSFCSFRCLANWASNASSKHDDRIV